MSIHTRQHGTHVTSPKDGAERMAAIQAIVDAGQYAKIDGTMIDLFSAGAILSVYRALTPDNQAKYKQIHAGRMALIAFTLTK